ncbi:MULTISPECIES: hypothetical protein [Bhargavaea]|uniref:Uncharacterized protein n=1 Tax=Bhargavaea changchunensis TaxID=2134037 RepID=A0ABW2NDG0_9BACL|nr:hypothetical protein [Bhargavaea sp. CC-171006]
MQANNRGKTQKEQIVDSFEVEPLFEDRPHERLAFTFNVEGDEYKGHFHNEEILWMHPHPKQLIGEETATEIEIVIHRLMSKGGHTVGDIEKIEVKPAFEDRPHERRQFALTVQGEEFKGLVHEGEIQWFHPQPHQKLEDEHVEELENRVHEEIGTQQAETGDKV